MRPIIKTDADIIGGWGLVPALDGDLATVTPSPTDPTAPTATTDQQTQTATITAVVQQTLLPPPPPPNACITADGHSFSQAFYIWLLKLQQRVGGFSASPTNDAAVLAYDPYPRPTEPSHDLSFDTSPRPTPFMEWQVDPSPRPTNPEDLWPTPDVRQWVLAQHYPSDSLVVHKAGTETITGDKTFTGLVNADEVRFTAGITPANTLGTTYWDADSQTLATIVDVTNGVALQHGQEVMIRCVNKTGSIITDGQVVYVNDAQGNRPTAALAKADNITTSMCIGVATQNIAINAEGFVTTIGLVHGYDTRAFIDGQKMYLSNVTAGLLTPTVPVSPGYLVMVATALNSTVNGSIFVHPEHPIALDSTLTADTDLASPSQKAVKAYFASGAVPPTRTISTTAPLTGGGDLSANRTFAIPAATASVNGYATSTQITKLDGIATGAQVNVLESVSGTAPVVVGAVTAKSQAISMAAATAIVPGYLTAADWTTFNSKLTSALTSGFIFVGNASNVATGVAVTGDAAMSNAGVLGVNKTRLNVRNETGVTIASTRAVYVNGFNNLPLILLADNTDEAKHNVVGITIAPIAHQADGFIATSGQCDAETNAWAVGTELYVSSAGVLTSTEPTSGEVRHAAIVTVRANYPTGKLLVYNGMESAVRGVGVGSGITDRLGDSAGATVWSLHNYADAEVAKITSLGALTALTVAKTGGTAAQFLKADGTVDSTLYTALPTTTAVASATLTAGQWVNFHNVAGAKNCRPADMTDATKPAQGFVLAGFASAATATVYLYGINTVIPVGAYAAADVGKPVFLSTAGGTTLTPPTTTGNLLQQVGWVDAVGATVTVNFTNSSGIVRA